MKALNKIFSALAFSSVIALSASVHAQDEAAAEPPPPDPLVGRRAKKVSKTASPMEFSLS